MAERGSRPRRKRSSRKRRGVASAKDFCNELQKKNSVSCKKYSKELQTGEMVEADPTLNSDW